MNQYLQEKVYRLGTIRQVRIMEQIGGMNAEESKLFELIHNGQSDIYIQQEMCLSRKAYQRIEEAVRAKLMLAVFQCINHYIDEYQSNN